MLEQAENVMKFMKQLKELKFEAKQLEELAMMSKQVPCLVQQLRAGSCAELEHAFKDVTMIAWKQVAQEELAVAETA